MSASAARLAACVARRVGFRSSVSAGRPWQRRGPWAARTRCTRRAMDQWPPSLPRACKGVSPAARAHMNHGINRVVVTSVCQDHPPPPPNKGKGTPSGGPIAQGARTAHPTPASQAAEVRGQRACLQRQQGAGVSARDDAQHHVPGARIAAHSSQQSLWQGSPQGSPADWHGTKKAHPRSVQSFFVQRPEGSVPGRWSGKGSQRHSDATASSGEGPGALKEEFVSKGREQAALQEGD